MVVCWSTSEIVCSISMKVCHNNSIDRSSVLVRKSGAMKIFSLSCPFSSAANRKCAQELRYGFWLKTLASRKALTGVSGSLWLFYLIPDAIKLATKIIHHGKLLQIPVFVSKEH